MRIQTKLVVSEVSTEYASTHDPFFPRIMSRKRVRFYLANIVPRGTEGHRWHFRMKYVFVFDLDLDTKSKIRGQTSCRGDWLLSYYPSTHSILSDMKEKIGFKDFTIVTMWPWARFEISFAAVLHIIMTILISVNRPSFSSNGRNKCEQTGGRNIILAKYPFDSHLFEEENRLQIFLN